MPLVPHFVPAVGYCPSGGRQWRRSARNLHFGAQSTDPRRQSGLESSEHRSLHWPCPSSVVSVSCEAAAVRGSDDDRLARRAGLERAGVLAIEPLDRRVT
jgi:hypothetical protein